MNERDLPERNAILTQLRGFLFELDILQSNLAILQKLSEPPLCAPREQPIHRQPRRFRRDDSNHQRRGNVLQKPEFRVEDVRSLTLNRHFYQIGVQVGCCKCRLRKGGCQDWVPRRGGAAIRRCPIARIDGKPGRKMTAQDRRDPLVEIAKAARGRCTENPAR